MTVKKPSKAKKVTKAPIKPEVLSVDESSPEVEAENIAGPEKYYESVGRRKESIARVRLFTKKASDSQQAESSELAILTINGKNYLDYFKDVRLQHLIESPLKKLKSLNRFKATVKVSGGGISGQAGATQHGLSRALELFDSNFRKKIKKSGFLARDPRAKERRKYGLKKARKAGQWSKR